MGLLASAQTLLGSVLSLARIRLELFGTELQEELTRLFSLLLGAGVVLLAGGLAALFGGLALLMSLREEYRALAACFIALVFFALAAAAAFCMLRVSRASPRAFDASLTELERDYEALRP